MPSSASFLSIWLICESLPLSSGQGVGWLSAGEEGIEIVGRPHAHGDARIARGAAEMRQEEHIVERPVTWIDLRFVAEYVKSRGGNPAGFKRRDQGIVIDDIAARCIDDDGALRQFVDQRPIHQPARF